MPKLRRAVEELSWLLTRGYPAKAALTLVGNRHALVDRQRKAVQRCAASDQAVAERRARLREPEALGGRELQIDGYNVLLTIEAAISGGLVLEARDGTFRDVAAMSRHYKRVASTAPALRHVGELLAGSGVSSVLWLFDRPISNSGRLARLLETTATEQGWPWRVELVANPDPLLRDSEELVATADSGILDRCGGWVNLARWVVESAIPEAWVVRFGAKSGLVDSFPRRTQDTRRENP
ncbi:MAG TPA: DUF434 domain-containing protein [Thermoanaerobaculia bacterium]|nr:DUF434 domain-containing protein [Thermoanaerobaculia bacterium]